MPFQYSELFILLALSDSDKHMLKCKQRFAYKALSPEECGLKVSETKSRTKEVRS